MSKIKEVKERGECHHCMGCQLKKDKQKQTLEELYNHIILNVNN